MTDDAESVPAAPLLIIVRFTTSLPDLTLPITSPQTTTTLALKRQIRTHLPEAWATNRLRLIHSGKVLPDLSTLSSALNLPQSPPPSQLPSSSTSSNNGKDKGKAPMRDPPQPEPRRIYIHCAIGDALTPEELAHEAAQAAQAAQESTPALSSLTSSSQPVSTTAAPRGFDRLLSAGFSLQEIAALRSQFLALQSHTHTPDTMPSAAELRILEDRWMDESAGGAGGGGDGQELGEAGLEDMLLGNIMGFFWPLGAVIWLRREEGVWSKSRQIAVVTGMLINIVFSVLKYTS
ncbi:MAG: hypothetical protein M1835_005605 [Candelina submexicana]|nr:MAG: hypothetical protein M1835_005605 [Candelina submexicana]